MTTLKFNRELTSKRQGNGPSVIFRKLADTGNNVRYQGSINVPGIKLIKSKVGNYTGLKIVFSDEHSIVGFEPVAQEKLAKYVFGATGLFSELNLEVGKRYKFIVKKLEGDKIIFVIDSDEHN